MSNVVLTRDTVTIQFGSDTFDLVQAIDESTIARASITLSRTSMTLTAITDDSGCEADDEDDDEFVGAGIYAFEREASDEEDDDATIKTSATFHAPSPKVKFASVPAPKRVTVTSSGYAPLPVFATANIPGPQGRLLTKVPPLVIGQVYAPHFHYTNAFNRIPNQQVVVGGPQHPVIRSMHPASRPIWLTPNVAAAEELDLPAPRLAMLDSPLLDYENGKRRTEKSDEEEADLEKNALAGDEEVNQPLPLPWRQASIFAMACFFNGVEAVKEAYEQVAARCSTSAEITPYVITPAASSSSLIIADKPAPAPAPAPTAEAPTLLKPALVRNKPLRSSNGSARDSTTLVASNSEESLTTRPKPRGPRPQPPNRRSASASASASVSASMILMSPNAGISTHGCPILTTLGGPIISSTSSSNCDCRVCQQKSNSNSVAFAVDLEAQLSVRTCPSRDLVPRRCVEKKTLRRRCGERVEGAVKWVKAVRWSMVGILAFAVLCLGLCIMAFVKWVN